MKAHAHFVKIAIAVFCCVLPMSSAHAQQTTTTPSSPVSQTTLNSNQGTPLSKDELKAQRKLQKSQEKASNANAKAAQSQAKAKKDQDKALQEQEKATGVVPKG